MSNETAVELERSVAQFFFEVGYGAAYAEAMIQNDMLPPFELTDAVVEHAWEVASEAHEDPQEFDHYLTLSRALPDVEAVLEEAATLVETLIRDGVLEFYERPGSPDGNFERPASLGEVPGFIRALKSQSTPEQGG